MGLFGRKDPSPPESARFSQGMTGCVLVQVANILSSAQMDGLRTTLRVQRCSTEAYLYGISEVKVLIAALVDVRCRSVYSPYLGKLQLG